MPSLVASVGGAAVLLARAVSALDNGVGRLPPMGYSTWNDMGCKGLSADAVKSVADTLVDDGFAKLGYRYVNVDDCWADGRDPQSSALRPSPASFPEGMRSVADYLHARQLKFGLYADRGVWTCGAGPGSAGHEHLDAQTFADWGVDYLKLDSCNAPHEPRQAMKQYVSMRDALNTTGRPIYFALCGWSPWYAEVGAALGNSWRVARDLNGFRELWNTVAINSVLAPFAGPGAWNDPDGLVGSTPGARVSMEPQQSRTQFTLWSIMAAPLMIGTSLRDLSQHDRETYTNEEVIAVDQDPLGRQGEILWESCPERSLQQLVREAEEDSYMEPPSCQQVWAKPLLGGDWAIAFVNWALEKKRVALHADQLRKLGFGAGADVRDLWARKELGVHTAGLDAQVDGSGGSQLFRLRPHSRFV